MLNISEYEIDRNKIVKEVCDFLEVNNNFQFDKIEDFIKGACIKKLCKVVGLTGNVNLKSKFFQFFASIIGEAICLKLKIKKHVACDELRLVKHEGINLVDRVVYFLENESPYECVIREAREETGLDISPIYRGIVTFVSDKYECEQMHLFTCLEYSGKMTDCQEGNLVWVKKSD